MHLRIVYILMFGRGEGMWEKVTMQYEYCVCIHIWAQIGSVTMKPQHLFSEALPEIPAEAVSALMYNHIWTPPLQKPMPVPAKPDPPLPLPSK